LLGLDLMAAIGRPLGAVVPEFGPLVAAARIHPERVRTAEVEIGPAQARRTLLLRIGADLGDSDAEAGPRLGLTRGFVATFDDITELQSAQRKAAWADVARRIAHEIKNPLTPIQLAAERLKRRFAREITSDPDTFTQCADTIIRSVGDIGRMVDEFSKFARMPKPVIQAEDVADTVRQAVFLMRVGNAEIDIDTDIAESPMTAQFDRRLISQALTNLIKNATEAIAAVPPEELGKGKIHLYAAREGGNIVIDVVDNGIGLPKENRSRLIEPYVTTREKGTGLGLAIVGRIV
jgi:two-component system nitrogen regulation sensor histidine kinase NtrY